MENGKLSIGCPSHITEFFLMSRLKKLIQDYPNIKINLDTESSSKKMIEELKNNEIDFIIIDVVNDNDLYGMEKEEIKQIDNVFVSREKINIINPKQMEEYKYILSYEDRTSTQKLNEVLKSYNLNLNAIFRCPTTEQRVGAAIEEIGIAYVMREAVKKELKTGQLYEMKVPMQLPISSISIVYIKNQLTKVDKEFIKNYLKQ